MIKLIDILWAVGLLRERGNYPYPKGRTVQPGISRMTRDIDRMVKYAPDFEKFRGQFYTKYRNYPNDPKANQELQDLWDLYKTDTL